MRRLEDEDSRSWDVWVGRESWGAFVAIFAPRGGEGVTREAPLAATSADGADRELRSLDREGLLALLRRSRPKNLG